MKKLSVLIFILSLFSCKNKTPQQSNSEKLNQIAENYVRLCLNIGEYDADFVDAYYGPDSLKPTLSKQDSFPKKFFLASIDSLINQLNDFNSETNDTLKQRADFLQKQLIACSRRVKIFSGEYASFDDESKELFGVVAPNYPESHFQTLIHELDSILPGKGNFIDRYQQLANHFIIPKEKLDTVFKTSIAECRKRTKEHYSLPSNESFVLEFVTDKPWSGYNWYKGNYQSVIQVNTDLQIFIDRAIDIGSHESYPGHHVYNMLLEKNIYHDKGWAEISVYLLFSPQSLIAEGSANYGIDLAFPGNEKNIFTKNVLLPLAGLDTNGLDTYYKAFEIRGELNYARNEVARGLVNGTMNEEEALRWLKDYGLMNDESAKNSIRFIRHYREYVINYNYGKDLVKNYIESSAGNDQSIDERWKLFEKLLSNEVTPEELMRTNQ